ncbi:hypothetical protein ENHY17A_110006 [Moraxellaceae bacterium 17A]|jgi:alcohol dehydrogenase|nr:hypothetical protein ENHY17A_110006 [Moraxellaceae bacterium 17A]
MAYKQISDQTSGFFIPSVSLFGPGCVKEVGSKAKDLGAKKALIVTDQGLNKAGVPDIIIKHLSEKGIDSYVFAGAEPNPTDKNVHDGVTAYQDNGRENHLMMLDHYQQTKNMLVSYSPKKMGFF